MLYLSGSKNRVYEKHLEVGKIGLLRTPNTGYRLSGVAVWAMDNGCFSDNYIGDSNYLALLDRLEEHRQRCLFVAVPDVIEDAKATLLRFPELATQLRSRGWPVALVAQDGIERETIPWGDLDWIFIGGSTEWKLSPAVEELIKAAQRRTKKVHVGRVNSFQRFQHFAALGCDSADGTFLAFGPEKNLPRLMRWIDAPVQLKIGDGR